MLASSSFRRVGCNLPILCCAASKFGSLSADVGAQIEITRAESWREALNASDGLLFERLKGYRMKDVGVGTLVCGWWSPRKGWPACNRDGGVRLSRRTLGCEFCTRCEGGRKL